jgi:hypothetical protein
MTESDWKPIRTAPLGKPILLWWRNCNYPAVGCWTVEEKENGREGWQCDGDMCMPSNQKDCTHWMPLPKPPATESETKLA